MLKIVPFALAASLLAGCANAPQSVADREMQYRVWQEYNANYRAAIAASAAQQRQPMNCRSSRDISGDVRTWCN